jgi:hypothetical protein
MNVAPAKPNSPRIDGAAIDCRKTRVRASMPGASPAAVVEPGR